MDKKKTKHKRFEVKKSENIALVIDLEATCWRGPPPEGMYNEIIEIGVTGVLKHIGL